MTLSFIRSLSLALGASAIAAMLAAPLFAEGNSTPKLDASLRLAMRSENAARQVQVLNYGKSANCADLRASNKVRVLVQVEDKGTQAQSFLAKNGGRITSRHGDVLCVTLPYHAIDGLTQLNSVKRVEASTALHPLNDVAAGAEYGTRLSNVLAHNPRYQGQGILMGIVDTGIDTSNQAFFDEEGKSRILYYWSLEKDIPERYPTVITPSGESRTFTYGAEYTAADVDAQDGENYVSLDVQGHGTHVAGIMGGRDNKYPGMAPQAKYIYASCRTLNEFLDATEYIKSRAVEMKRPVVINCSVGSDLGPHDGTSLVERALQNSIENDNLLICCATGNEGSSSMSAHASVPAHSSVSVASVFTSVGNEYTADDYNSLDIWSHGDPDLSITLTRVVSPSSQAQRTIAYDEEILDGEPFGEGVVLTCAKEYKAPFNNDDRALVVMHSTTDDIREFPLSITLTNNGDEDAVVDMFMGMPYGYFLNCVATDCLSTPAVTPGAIAVGSYNTRIAWEAIGGKQSDAGEQLGELSSFSSTGPVRRPDLFKALDVIKPDIVAPGARLISQLSHGYDRALEEHDRESWLKHKIDATHFAMRGTSMATPMVTGTVALLLQNMPQATAAQIKEVLHATARTDSSMGEAPNDKYGYGKLSASCLESPLLVSPKPTITEVERDSKNRTDLIIKGSNFVPASDVYLNGLLWSTEKVTLVDFDTMILHEVFSSESPLNVDGTIKVENVKVVNLLGAPGAKTAEFKADAGDDHDSKHVSSGSGGCFIATAAYGSYLEPEVMALRRFRDRDLVTNAPGREFVSLYYRYSPPVAAFIAEHPSARFATRIALTPLVYSVSHPQTALATVLALGLGGLLYRRRRKKLQK